MKQNKTFLLLGITGGAGSGKTTVVEIIQEIVPTVFLHCDVIAHELMQPGGASYEVLVREFGEQILKDEPEENGTREISRKKLAEAAMATDASRKRLNGLTHPLVQKKVEEELVRLAEEKYQGVVVIEAALLIEAGYKSLCDTVWYVHAPLADRIRRMKEKRGYSEEKISGILAGQLSEEEFLANADVVIENPDRPKEEARQVLSKKIAVLLKDFVESADKM